MAAHHNRGIRLTRKRADDVGRALVHPLFPGGTSCLGKKVQDGDLPLFCPDFAALQPASDDLLLCQMHRQALSIGNAGK